MLSAEQEFQLREVVCNYGLTLLRDDPEPIAQAGEQILALVASWLDPLRPRDPKAELPANGQEVFFRKSAGESSVLEARRYNAAQDERWFRIVCLWWWPAPAAPKETP